ncbi:MAG: tryptophan synthase subunit alpha [Phycisphaerae bacterium]|nr:tryptophan synthase subunit alpha [Phycisphaerae bacterium]
MTDLQNNRLIQTFADLRANGKKTLLPFLTAGYPDSRTTTNMLSEVERRGARICELGVPFSDPIADGPVIQASYTAALDGGFTLAGLFESVREYRATGGPDGGPGGLALLAMVSYSIVYRYGCEKFCADAAAAGFDGLIVPDLPLGQADNFATLAASAGLCNVLLISPTTPQQRRIEIAKASSGFVYFMSVAGITGERTVLPPSTIEAVAELETHTDTPICIGFGISSADMVEEVCGTAEGAIVGSAIIHKINDAVAANAPSRQIVETVGQFVEKLLQPIR